MVQLVKLKLCYLSQTASHKLLGIRVILEAGFKRGRFFPAHKNSGVYKVSANITYNCYKFQNRPGYVSRIWKRPARCFPRNLGLILTRGTQFSSSPRENFSDFSPFSAPRSGGRQSEIFSRSRNGHPAFGDGGNRCFSRRIFRGSNRSRKTVQTGGASFPPFFFEHGNTLTGTSLPKLRNPAV